MAGEIRSTADHVDLVDYEILSLHRTNVARSDVRIWAKATTLTKEIEGEFSFVAFRYKTDGNVAMPSEDGRWRIQQNFMYKVMHQKFADKVKNQDTKE